MKRSVCYVEKWNNNPKTQNTKNINTKGGGVGEGGKKGWPEATDNSKIPIKVQSASEDLIKCISIRNF